MKKIIIVGGVAGGASAAARLRRLDENMQIIMFERGEFISFANCGLPYYIGGIIEDRNELLLQTPESFEARFNVDVRVMSEVVEIDRSSKTVTVKSGADCYIERYDTLILSTGSSPFMPKIKGIESNRVMKLWTIPDMDRIVEAAKSAKSVVVVGGGFIGVEVADNLTHLGLKVTIVDMMEQVMPNVDFDMAQILHKHLTKKGVKLALGQSVKSFAEAPDGIIVKTDKGEYQADFAILSIGVKPNSELAVNAGLKVNNCGGIVVNEALKTSDENIYAVGDVVETVNFINSERCMMPLAGPANKMGRMAADNIFGLNRSYKGTQGSSVAKVFDLVVASTGASEKQLMDEGKEINKDYRVTMIHPLSHAGYYPGGKPLCLKVIFGLDGKVYGAAGVGYEGVDKRIDVIATAIRFGATTKDLAELELCYAPPFSSGKDPVNMAGFSGENILGGVVDNITYKELSDIPADTVILDVRTKEECDRGVVPGSINIPVDSLRDQINTMDKTKSYVVYCAVGVRAYIACRILMNNGFKNVRNLAGGYTTYRVVSADYTTDFKKV